MRSEDVRLFLAAVASGSVAAAARREGLSGSGAARSLERLETDVGARLLHRSTRSRALTEEGVRFLPYARRLLELVTSAADFVHGQGLSGRLRLTASSTFARLHLGPMLAAFAQRHPELRFELQLTDRAVDLVGSGLDLAIRIGPLANSAFKLTKLVEDRRVLCVAPSYRARFGPIEKPEDLVRLPCAVLSRDETWLFEEKGRSVQVRPHSLIWTDHGDFTLKAAEEGMAAAWISEWHAADALASGRLVRELPQARSGLKSWIHALHPFPRDEVPERVRRFLDFLVERFDPPPWAPVAEAEAGP
ncbi:MAG: LysR substrate-binding domain-containing protein [Myxococcota bacterium]